MVEKIVDKTEAEDGVHFLIKWRGLHYDECNWESEKLCKKLDADLDKVNCS